MRLLICNYEFPPIGGGAGSASAHLARCLAARGVEVCVVSARFDGLPHREERDGYTIVRVPAIRRHAFRCTPPEMLSYVAGGLLPTIGLVRRWRPAVSIAYHGIPSGLLSLALKARCGVPYVVSMHGGDVPGFMKDDLAFLHTVTKPAIRYIWRRAAALTACSDGLERLARRTWPDAPIEVIPNGVEIEHFRPTDRARPATPFRLLSVGRLTRQKGLSYLIEALRHSRQDTVLRIVGDGPDRPGLEQQAEAAGLAGRVEFAGWADRAAVAAHYQWADAYVQPSLEEGMAVAVLEALASGLPIITSDVYGTNMLVENGRNGFTVPPREAGALAGAINQLVATPKLVEEFGRTSREKSIGFSWEAAADQHLKLFEAIIERSGDAARR